MAKEKKDEKEVVQDIGNRLAERDSSDIQTSESQDMPVSVAPQMMDLNSMTPDQLQNLKAALDAVPSGRIRDKKGKENVTLRSVDGKIVVDFGRAFNKYVTDPERRGEVLRTFIGVTYLGEKEEKVIPYREFMSSERIKCEVVSVSVKEDDKSVGEVFSREKKIMIPMIVTWEERVYTIKLPSGDLLEINGTKVNA